MKKTARIAGLVFVALSVAETILLAFGVEEAHVIIKPFLIPSLAAAALLSLLPEHKGKLVWWLTAGLAFHTAGDILLLLDGYGFIYFALGLGSFLVGHVFYLLVLCSGIGRVQSWKEVVALAAPLLIAPFAANAFGAGTVMTIVLSVYAYALIAYCAVGIIWALRGQKYAWMVIIGGLVFILSDALIAINAFAGLDFPLRHAAVMSTYLIAEWLLVSTMTKKQVHC